MIISKLIMYESQKKYILKNIKSNKIKKAFLSIPRENFVLKKYKDYAYEDSALLIEENQTISQPSLVLQIIELLEPKKTDKVLEIGTGSGYNVSILSLLVDKIYSIERINTLAIKAKKRLKDLNIKNVSILIKDGSMGDIKHSPFDKIIITAAIPKLPQILIKQLKNNGIIVFPRGNLNIQKLIKGVKKQDKIVFKDFGLVKFVPLIGKYGFDN